MARTTDQRIALMAGEAALPRKNGELVFQAPWEGRAFGLAVAMSDRHHFPWNAFRERLIGEIASAEARGAASSYYERWLAAFERVAIEHGLIGVEELDAKTAECAEEDDHDE
ncbi:MAG: nitrile hydratase accessory protein [Chloroflexota bacterium]